MVTAPAHGAAAIADRPDRWVKNSHGVKDGADCYRTIGGVRWLWWAEDADLFKRAGVRHRTAPEGVGTFVHPDDDAKAFAAVTAFEGRAHISQAKGE